MLPCPKCGFDNELGRIFCSQCGTKLDLDAIKPPSRGGKSLRKKRPFSAGRAIGWAVRGVLLALVIWGVFLFFRVPPVREIAVADLDLNGYYKGRDKLELAVARRQALSVTLTESQLNAYLDTHGFEHGKGDGLKVTPTNLQVELGEGVVTAIIVGKISLAKVSLNLSFSLTGKPVVKDGKFTLEPEAAQAGSLPIPRLVLQKTGLIQSYYKQLYGSLTDEARLLGSCDTITVADGKATFNYQPKPGSP